eukprot:7389170-Prymnesium_polylepis.1
MRKRTHKQWLESSAPLLPPQPRMAPRDPVPLRARSPCAGQGARGGHRAVRAPARPVPGRRARGLPRGARGDHVRRRRHPCAAAGQRPRDRAQ